MVYYIVAILIIIGHLAKRVAYAADFQGKVGNLAYNISTVRSCTNRGKSSIMRE